MRPVKATKRTHGGGQKYKIWRDDIDVLEGVLRGM